MGYCQNTTARCNCDGSLTQWKDDGKIMDKSKLPILGVYTPPSVGVGYVRIWELMCAAKPFGKFVKFKVTISKKNTKIVSVFGNCILFYFKNNDYMYLHIKWVQKVLTRANSNPVQ